MSADAADMMTRMDGQIGASDCGYGVSMIYALESSGLAKQSTRKLPMSYTERIYSFVCNGSSMELLRLVPSIVWLSRPVWVLSEIAVTSFALIRGLLRVSFTPWM